jgi:cytoskeleton protein RodZ
MWFVVAMLACAGVYTHWQNSERTVVEIEPIAKSVRPPTHSAAPVSVPVESALPAQRVKPEFRAAEISESGAIHVAAAPLGQSGQPELVEPVSPPTNAALMQVAFTATEPVWVSVRSDGARAYSGTLEVKQSREFGASKKMTVLTGNAGALEISLNGKPVGPIGPRGEIRLIELTPQGAHVVSRTPPPTAEDPAAPAAERP